VVAIFLFKNVAMQLQTRRQRMDVRVRRLK